MRHYPGEACRRWNVLVLGLVLTLLGTKGLASTQAEEPGAVEISSQPEDSALPEKLSAALQYLPDHCIVCGWFDLGRSPQTRSWLKTSLDAGSIDRIVFGATEISLVSGINLSPTNCVMVVTLTTPQPIAKLQAAETQEPTVTWTEERIGDTVLYVPYVSQPGKADAFFLANDTTLVDGPAEVLRTILRRSGPATLPEPLAKACERLDAQKPFAYAAAPATFLQHPALTLYLPDALCHGVEAIVAEGDWKGGFQVRLSLLCVDEPTSYQLLGMLELARKPLLLWLQQSAPSPGLLQAAATLHTGVEDRCVTVEATLPQELLATANLGPQATPATVTAPPQATLTPVPVSALNVTPVAVPVASLGSGVYGYTSATAPVVPVAGPNAGAPGTPAPPTASLPATQITPASPITGAPASVACTPASGPPNNNPYCSQPGPVAFAGSYAYPAAANSSPYFSPKGDLTVRCAELERRLHQVERDRDLLAERVEFYTKQLESYRRELGVLAKSPSAPTTPGTYVQ